MKGKLHYFLPIASGILLGGGWPNSPLFFLLFLGYSLLFIYLEKVSKEKLAGLKSFLGVYVATAIFTLIVLYWCRRVIFSTLVATTLTNFFLFSLAMFVFPFIRRKTNRLLSFIFFGALLVSYHWFHEQWQAGFPYITTGLGLGKFPEIIQWYRFLGVDGGSIWILGINIMIAEGYFRKKEKAPIKKLGYALVSTSLVPIALSLVMWFIPEKKADTVKVATTQHYYLLNEEDHKNPTKVVDRLLEQTEGLPDEDVSMVIWPETIISNLGWIGEMGNGQVLKYAKQRIKETNSPPVLVGGIAFKQRLKTKYDVSQYGVDTLISGDKEIYYTVHNMSVLMDSNKVRGLRAKKMLVPFQERVPYADKVAFLRDLIVPEGIAWKLTDMRQEKEIFKLGKKNSFVPLLCYESMFPIYLSQMEGRFSYYAVLANENWNDSPYGSEQYMQVMVPIAIQTGKYFVKSSNNGVSGVVTSKGKLEHIRRGEDTGFEVAEVKLYPKGSFYNNIAGLPSYFAIAFMLFILAKSIIKRK